MTPDETVMALRWLAKETEFTFSAENLNGAADLIESMQAQISKLENRIAAEGFYDLETMISKYKTVMLAANEISIKTDEELEELRAQLAASQRRERAAVEELQILHEWLGGELPKRCDECELWGKGGWSQYGIGYCEGDDHPHKGTDFCNRWRGQEAGKGKNDADD